MPFWRLCPCREQHLRWRSGWHDCPSVLSDKLLAAPKNPLVLLLETLLLSYTSIEMPELDGCGWLIGASTGTLCAYNLNRALSDQCANGPKSGKHWGDKDANDTNGQGNLHNGVALLLDDDAAHVALVKQFFHSRDQLLTHYL